MKVGVLGDIHANLPALQAVLSVLQEEGCDTFVSVGDVVGYGPCPAECIQLLREKEAPCVLGNHDHHVTLIMDPRLAKLRPEVRHSIEWTQSVLKIEDLKWLAQLPQTLDFEDFSLVHGAFGPNPYLYLTSEKHFEQNFSHQEAALGFCGHSHIPCYAYHREGEPLRVNYLRQFTVPEGVRVMVNVGSVGQPRDHDPRAAFGVYDTAERSVKLLRVPYDIGVTQDLMRKAKLPQQSIDRLAIGR